jgi:hypothetical protein
MVEERSQRLHGYLRHNKVAAIAGGIAIFAGIIFFLPLKPATVANAHPEIDLGTDVAVQSDANEPASEPPPAWKPPRYETKLVWPGYTDSRPTFTGPRTAVLSTSGTSHQYIAIGGRVHEVATGKILAKYPSSNVTRTAISEDGKHFAQLRTTDVEQQLLIHRVGATETKPRQLVELPLSAKVGVLRFAGQRLIVQEQKVIGSKLSVFNATDGGLVASFTTDAFEERSFAISPDRQQLVFAGVLGINFHNIETGQPELVIRPPDTGHPATSCNGLAFSPDGKLLAALLHDNVFVIFDLEERTRKLTHRLAGTITQATGSNGSIQWLPDGRGWILNGSSLLLANPMIEAWRVTTKPQSKCFVVDSNNLLVAEQSDQRTTLKPIAIPWQEVEQNLQTTGSPLLETGGEIAFALNLNEVNPRLVERLTNAIRNRCEALGLNIRSNARMQLLLDFTESKGTTRVLATNKLLTNSGVLDEMTEFDCNFRVKDSLTQRIVWRYKFKTDGGVQVIDDGTQSPRERSLQAVLSRIAFMNLPSLVLEDPKFAFPINAPSAR